MGMVYGACVAKKCLHISKALDPFFCTPIVPLRKVRLHISASHVLHVSLAWLVGGTLLHPAVLADVSHLDKSQHTILNSFSWGGAGGGEARSMYHVLHRKKH